MTALALIIAVGILLARGLTVILRRTGHAPDARLLRSLDVRPTGADGRWTRRDHLRAAGVHALTFVGCAGVAMSIMLFADRWVNGSPMNMAFSYPGLTIFFLAFFFLWLAGRSILRAILNSGRPGAA